MICAVLLWMSARIVGLNKIFVQIAAAFQGSRPSRRCFGSEHFLRHAGVASRKRECGIIHGELGVASREGGVVGVEMQMRLRMSLSCKRNDPGARKVQGCLKESRALHGRFLAEAASCRVAFASPSNDHNTIQTRNPTLRSASAFSFAVEAASSLTLASKLRRHVQPSAPVGLAPGGCQLAVVAASGTSIHPLAL